MADEEITEGTPGKKYSSLEELYASDEYKSKGVLGREQLRSREFPETIPVSNAQGTRSVLASQEQPMATRQSAPSVGNELGSA